MGKLTPARECETFKRNSGELASRDGPYPICAIYNALVSTARNTVTSTKYNGCDGNLDNLFQTKCS